MRGEVGGVEPQPPNPRAFAALVRHWQSIQYFTGLASKISKFPQVYEMLAIIQCVSLSIILEQNS